RLDAALFLTAQQRDAITRAIAEHWQDKWENWLMLSVYGGQYMPQIPEKCVECLTADQKGVWQGLPKIEVGVFNFNLGGPVVNDDGWWEGKADKKPPSPQAERFFNRLLERLK